MSEAFNDNEIQDWEIVESLADIYEELGFSGDSGNAYRSAIEAVLGITSEVELAEHTEEQLSQREFYLSELRKRVARKIGVPDGLFGVENG